MFNKTPADEIKEVELSIEEAKKLVDTAEAIDRLSRNRDFKKVILDLYFHENAARLAHLYSDPNVEREEVHNGLIAIGELKRFLGAQKQMGENARYAIEGHEQTLEELRAEDAQE